jgi:plasmid stabilization system protein ParE
VRLLDEAEEEAREAARWYEERRPGLGEAFLQALADALEAIEKHPTRHAAVSGVPANRQVRRFLLGRFPYKLVYEILTSEVLVLAVAHTRRHPTYWKNRSDSAADQDAQSD